MKYLSVLIVLFTKMAFAQNTKGDVFFASSTIHTVNLNFTQLGYWDSLKANYLTDTYMKCNIEIDGTSLPICGVKFKGNSSYNNPSDKKSFKLDFNEYISGQKLDGLKKLNLNNCFKDPSFMREKLFLDYLNKLGIAAPRCTYTKVYLNGAYWGLYTAVEEVNKDFLDDRFEDDKGNLFKGDPTGDLKWYGSNPSSYQTKYELHTNETQNYWGDLIYFIDKINNSPSQTFKDSLNKIFHVSPFIKAWAASSLFANLDSYIGSGHNYYVYHDSLTNKFNWVTWDVNEAFGNFTQGMSITQMEQLSVSYLGGGNNGANRPLCSKLMTDQTLKDQYLNEICYQAGYHFLPAYWFPKIDSLKNRIKNDVYTDPKKTYTNAQFDQNIDTTITVPTPMGSSSTAGIKSFMNRRRTSVVSQMALAGCAVGLSEFNNMSINVEVFPNPFQEFLHVKIIGHSRPELIDQLGKLQDHLIVTESAKEYLIDCSNLPAGMYFIRYNNTVKKLIKTE